MAVPTVGKRVFLRAVSTIPTVMHRMTPSPATVKKAAYGRSKSPPLAVQKQLLIEGPPESPSSSLPKRRELLPAVFDVVAWCSFPLGKAGMGLAATLVILFIMQGITPMANLFFSGASRAFFTAIGGLFVFVVFQPAYGQARLGGAANIRELALVDISAPLWRIGRSPEKLQIFLYYSPIAFCLVRELKYLTIAPLF